MPSTWRLKDLSSKDKERFYKVLPEVNCNTVTLFRASINISDRYLRMGETGLKN
jgi:hypothetical protein